MIRRAAAGLLAAAFLLTGCGGGKHPAGHSSATTKAATATSAPPSTTGGAGGSCPPPPPSRAPNPFDAAVPTADDDGSYCLTIQPVLLQDPAPNPDPARYGSPYRYVGIKVRVTNTWNHPFGLDGTQFTVGGAGSGTPGETAGPAQQRRGSYLTTQDIQPGQTVAGLVGFPVARDAVLTRLEFRLNSLTDRVYAWSLPGHH